MKINSDEIKSFIKYFDNHIENIGKIHVENDFSFLYQKVLYICLIDAMLKSVYEPERGKNKIRMIRFIDIFSGWENSGKISLPHLKRLLDKSKNNEYQKLLDYVNKKLENWIPGEVKYLENDIGVEEIASLLPKALGENKIFKNIKIIDLKHTHLFYTYRNSIVHELTLKDYSWETHTKMRKEEPYYSYFEVLGPDVDDPSNNYWALHYPALFLKKVCKNSLKKLEELLIENDLNPRKNYSFSNYWLKDLD
ncbi:MAG: hypothetical protein HON98_12580 [Chloroflexi bacterium]|jgi:hypothetical protein|nr:hypothetical protein [Chloroflexota bacterium]MBT4002955.1 hypothetical protein [Chloroflexota bacterium]MBT4305797.1 hypothetical protein [Chloroflexota bacterium]MBT4533621.1 hypothetical protein [Chloroflexota bacterium]MBT4681736.1 hypothetical protein [Chloroflexota bacterium]